MKSLRFNLLMIALLLFSCLSCRKTAKTTVYGSGYTYLMCGPHSFHHIISGYDHITQDLYIDSSDVNLTIIFVDSATVSISGEGDFKYTSKSTDSILNFIYTDLDNHLMDYEINFNHYTGQISIVRLEYISPAGGTTDETFSSF